jgi:hypothetical protein
MKETKMTKRHAQFREWFAERKRQNFNLAAIRNALMIGAVMAMVPVADAQTSTTSSSSTSYFASLTNLVCGISSTISGPWLYAISIVVIILGAIAIASSESSIVKLISTVFIGLGIAASASTVVTSGMGISSSCTSATA